MIIVWAYDYENPIKKDGAVWCESKEETVEVTDPRITAALLLGYIISDGEMKMAWADYNRII